MFSSPTQSKVNAVKEALSALENADMPIAEYVEALEEIDDDVSSKLNAAKDDLRRAEAADDNEEE